MKEDQNANENKESFFNLIENSSVSNNNNNNEEQDINFEEYHSKKSKSKSKSKEGSQRNDSKQNINTIKTHFSIKNLYLPSEMNSEADLEKLIMDIFYKKYDMPLKFSKICVDTISPTNDARFSTFICKIGFKYVTDAVKLYDKDIFIEYKLFPFRIMGAFNIEASSVFKSFVVAHKERMKNKIKPIFPPIKRRKLVVRSRSNSNSRFKRKESEDRKKTPIRNSGMMGVNHINNYMDFREKDYIKEKDYNKDYYKEKDSYYNKDYSKDYQKDYHQDYSKDYNKEYSREYGNIKDYNLKEKDYYKEKEKNRRKRSRSRSRSVSSGKTSIKNSSERYRKRSNKKEKENIDSKAAYIMGVSDNFNIALFSSQLKQRNQHIPSKFEFIMKQEEGFNCNYFKLYFDDEKSCQKLIENSVECGSNILLVLPCFENVNFLIKKTIEDMLPQYQVIIKGKDKDLANIDFSTEISSVYRFFCNYGKIVDFNLEFLPNMIYITYKQKSSVKKLIDCNGSIEYINNNGVTCRFNASKNDFAIYVRNIKDPNKTYENFIPRRQQMKVNTYNPLVGNMQQNKHNGMFSLLNTNLIGSLGNDILPNHSLMGQMNQSLNTQMNSQMTNSHESGGGHSNLPLSSSLQNSGLGSSSGLNNSFNYFQK